MCQMHIATFTCSQLMAWLECDSITTLTDTKLLSVSMQMGTKNDKQKQEGEGKKE